jgi:hypothetical protein
MGIFVWALRSQGLEPNAKSFCSMHELLYETKPWGKEQCHNNFGCYSFIARSGSSSPVPTFRKRWPGDWTKEWFYVKNYLKAREDIKDIIMRPIWQRFGLHKPKVEIDEAVEECHKAFGLVCSFIWTRDLVQEHVAYRIWLLLADWEVPKESISNPHEGGLVRLKYTFRFRDQFIEPDDDWLKSVEATSDDLLGLYSRAEDNTLSAAFGNRKKKRLNRVFDAIGFMYPNYRYPPRGQKRKSEDSRRDDASAASSEPTPKRKRVKVLTHRPCYIEPAVVPDFGGESSSASEGKNPAISQKSEPTATPKASPAKSDEPKAINIEEMKVGKTRILEAISPSAEVGVPQAQKGPAVTPKRKRMVNVLDVLEIIKSSSSTPEKVAEAQKAQIETTASGGETTKHQTEIKTGPSESAKEKSLETEGENKKETLKQILSEKLFLPLLNHLSTCLIILCDMLRAKYYLKKKNEKLIIMPRN